MTTAQTRTFYRCVGSRQPSDLDFTSNAVLGLEMYPPDTPTRRRLWEGISVYDTLERAAWRAQQLRPPARWVAGLAIPVGGPIVVEKTFKDPNHFTAWGAPQAFQECVISVVRVPAVAR